jgi:hypothetical protein
MIIKIPHSDHERVKAWRWPTPCEKHSFISGRTAASDCQQRLGLAGTYDGRVDSCCSNLTKHWL